MARPCLTAWLLAAAIVACGKGPQGAPPGSSSAGEVASSTLAAAPGPFALDEAWERAKDGDEEELARLVRQKGVPGIVAGLEAGGPAKPIALRALAVAPGYGQVLLLAQTAEAGDDETAELALVGAVTIAARARSAEEIEDAAELREGCDLLLRIAKNPNTPRKRRILTVGALRMFADRGIVSQSEVPAP